MLSGRQLIYHSGPSSIVPLAIVEKVRDIRCTKRCQRASMGSDAAVAVALGLRGGLLREVLR